MLPLMYLQTFDMMLTLQIHSNIYDDVQNFEFTYNFLMGGTIKHLSEFHLHNSRFGCS